MKKYFEQLNPQERRIVVGVGLVAFIVLNIWLVWPHFGDLKRASLRMEKAENTLRVFQNEIARTPTYQRKVNDLKSGGEDVQLDDQAIYFDRTYREKALENGVEIMGNSRPNTRTNEFFLEQEIGLAINAGESNLVNFLYSLGSGGSMIRVRSMSLRPDSSHEKLAANITLVASFQKQASAPRSGASVPAGGAPGVPGSKANAPGSPPAALITNRHS